MKHKTTILILLILCLPISVRAQFEESRIGVGLVLGGTKLYGDIPETNTGFTAGLLVNYQPVPYFALTTSATRGNATIGLDAIKTNLLNMNLFAAFYAFPHSKIRPLGMLGLSYFHYNTKDGSGNPFLRSDGSEMKSWDTAFQVGAGLEIMAAAPWAMTFMVNYNLTSVDELDAITQGGSDGFLNGFVGLVRYFNLNGQPPARKEVRPRPEITTAPKPGKRIAGGDTGVYSDGIYFEPGSARLLGKSRAKLTALYEFLRENPDKKIQLIGTAADPAHANLMTQRAQAVMNYLVQKGIIANRIVITTK